MDGERAHFQSDQVKVRLQSGTWNLVDWEARAVLPEGTSVNLEACATLIALLNAEAVLPPLASTAG